MMIFDDDIHYNSKRLDSFNKTFNFIISGRGSGKSTRILKKVLDAYKRDGSVTLWLMRNETQYTDFYVSSFLNHFEQYEGLFTKPSGVYDGDRNTPVVIFAAISTAMAKIKSIQVDKVKFIIFEEFIPNLRLPNQRYQKNEAETLLTVYDTIARNNNYLTKVYWLGNPYQLNNPYFQFFKIDPKKVRENKGKIYIPHPDIAIDYFDTNAQIKALRAETPYARVARINDEYYRTSFEGDEASPPTCRVMKVKPESARLSMVIKVEGADLMVYTLMNPIADETYKWKIFIYWCEIGRYNGQRVKLAIDLDDFDETSKMMDSRSSERDILTSFITRARSGGYIVDQEATDYYIRSAMAVIR